MGALESVKSLFTKNLRQSGIYLAFVAIIILFYFLTDGILLTPQNVTNIVVQNSYILILAIGMVIVIIAGHIDLSVGSVVAFTGQGNLARMRRKACRSRSALRTRSVSIQDGCAHPTPTPRWATSSRSALVRDSTPALLAAYAARPGSDGKDAAEATTSTYPLRSMTCGRAACTVR